MLYVLVVFCLMCYLTELSKMSLFFFQAEDCIRDADVTGVQTCALPIATNIAGQEQDEVAQLVGRSAQAEFGVVTVAGGQKHEAGLGGLDDRGEVAAHGRLEVGDGSAHALEEQAGHARQEALPAGEAP